VIRRFFIYLRSKRSRAGGIPCTCRSSADPWPETNRRRGYDCLFSATSANRIAPVRIKPSVNLRDRSKYSLLVWTRLNTVKRGESAAKITAYFHCQNIYGKLNAFIPRYISDCFIRQVALKCPFGHTYADTANRVTIWHLRSRRSRQKDKLSYGPRLETHNMYIKKLVFVIFVHAGFCSPHSPCRPAAAPFPRQRTRACERPPGSGRSTTSTAGGVYPAATHTHTHTHTHTQTQTHTHRRFDSNLLRFLTTRLLWGHWRYLGAVRKVKQVGHYFLEEDGRFSLLFYSDRRIVTVTGRPHFTSTRATVRRRMRALSLHSWGFPLTSVYLKSLLVARNTLATSFMRLSRRGSFGLVEEKQNTRQTAQKNNELKTRRFTTTIKTKPVYSRCVCMLVSASGIHEGKGQNWPQEI